MPRYFLEFCFKGTSYSGWQIQDNAVSVQQKVNEALSILLSTPVQTHGCGRTDTGVHAKQFFAHFDAAIEPLDNYKFVHQLNSILPHDISVFDIYPVDAITSARFNAIARTYEYYLYHHKNPFFKDYAAKLLHEIDEKKINKACEVLLKFEDFKCFSKSKTDVNHTNCKITFANWQSETDSHLFTITANRFLRGMVRAIVGTLLKVGKGEISIEDFIKIIESKERSEAGASVDARGLYLSKVEYPFLKIERKFEFPFPVKNV